MEAKGNKQGQLLFPLSSGFIPEHGYFFLLVSGAPALGLLLPLVATMFQPAVFTAFGPSMPNAEK